MKKNKNLIKNEEKGTKKNVDIEVKAFIALIILIIIVGIIFIQLFVESVTRAYYNIKQARNITTTSQIEELEETQAEEINNLKSEIETLQEQIDELTQNVDDQFYDLEDRVWWIEREVMW